MAIAFLRRRPERGEDRLERIVDNTGSSATTYTDTNVDVDDEAYIYRVIALLNGERSKWSERLRVAVGPRRLWHFRRAEIHVATTAEQYSAAPAKQYSAAPAEQYSAAAAKQYSAAPAKQHTTAAPAEQYSAAAAEQHASSAANSHTQPAGAAKKCRRKSA